MKNSRLNIRLLKKVRDRIKNIPQSYYQGTWCSANADAPCGTVACIAGETIICSEPTVAKGIAELKYLDNKDEVPEKAMELLGLNWSERLVLFNGEAEGWPSRFKKKFQSAKTRRGEAGAAVAYLDHIIKTGKVVD